MAHAVVKDHWAWAFRVVWFFGAVTVLRLVLLRRESGRLLVAMFVRTGFVGLGRLREAGDRGGQLVYQYRVGTSHD
jgi:hypothetical protein